MNLFISFTLTFYWAANISGWTGFLGYPNATLKKGGISVFWTSDAVVKRSITTFPVENGFGTGSPFSKFCLANPRPNSLS
jgi:hypothetical protein